jgi:hypothetical protein
MASGNFNGSENVSMDAIRSPSTSTSPMSAHVLMGGNDGIIYLLSSWNIYRYINVGYSITQLVTFSLSSIVPTKGATSTTLVNGHTTTEAKCSSDLVICSGYFDGWRLYQDHKVSITSAIYVRASVLPESVMKWIDDN